MEVEKIIDRCADQIIEYLESESFIKYDDIRKMIKCILREELSKKDNEQEQ